jgi:hypothetical protein
MNWFRLSTEQLRVRKTRAGKTCKSVPGVLSPMGFNFEKGVMS